MDTVCLCNIDPLELITNDTEKKGGKEINKAIVSVLNDLERKKVACYMCM